MDTSRDRFRLARGRSLAAALALAAILATGCTPAPTPPKMPPRLSVTFPANEPTATMEWGPTRTAPEMSDFLRIAAEGYANFKDEPPLKGRRLGKGRFLGVVVSWIPPNAKTFGERDYAEVLVTPDGRIGEAPDARVPFGFATDGYTYGDESTAMLEYKQDAITLAKQYIEPGILEDAPAGKRGTVPFVSAYVLEYGWGLLGISPSGDYEEVTHAPDGGYVLIEPLPMAERRRLDSLDATQVAELYLTTTDPAVAQWLTEPRSRLDFLSSSKLLMRKAPKATATARRGRGEKIESLELYFSVEPSQVVFDDAFLFLKRRTTTSPWRVIGMGM